MHASVTIGRARQRILAKAAGEQRAISFVLAFTGLRGSELRGVRWQDVDLTDPAKGTITVNQRADQYGVIGEVTAGPAIAPSRSVRSSSTC